ncbi:GGDEF domain-containing protein [Novosphingobium profundi]|uniref:GGDEF domain-containing protein n=1 Tax=Novosphingobium profundi TaxID=1774954 RepID=UPI0031BB6663
MKSTSAQALCDKILVEQVRSLFANTVPATFMLVAFGITGVIAYSGRPSRAMEVIGTIAFLGCATRLAVTLLLRDHALTAPLDRRAARRLEMIFAGPYLTFSTFLGLFAALAFLRHPPQIHIVTICLVMGYGAGVATNCALRPWLAISSMSLAVVPMVTVSCLANDPAYVATALITLGFLAAGGQSVIVRCRAYEREIGLRLRASLLARHDALTALPNRLALAEYFREAVLTAPQRLLAVHFLDLDGFKLVNDAHGHAVGDALLADVAERLRGAVRAGDIAARLGGDEFVIVQFGLDSPAEADVLARRISAAIRAPFDIQGLALTISTSVGTIVSEGTDQELERLLEQADARLYDAKSKRRVAYLQVVPA